MNNETETKCLTSLHYVIFHRFGSRMYIWHTTINKNEMRITRDYTDLKIRPTFRFADGVLIRRSLARETFPWWKRPKMRATEFKIESRGR